MNWNILGRYNIEKNQTCGNMRYVPTKANGVRIRGLGLRERAAGRNARTGWDPKVNSGERHLEFTL